MTRRPISLYSDSQTRPTPAMLAAMTSAPVGDEQRRLDPTVIELERRVAALLGHEAALFLPSGTMCNLVGLLLHVRTGGDEVILERGAHPLEFEAAGGARLAGAAFRTIDSVDGVFTAQELEAALRPASDRYAPRTRLVHAEQATGSGHVWPPEVLRAVADRARAHGRRSHLDGARLLNACVATGVAAADYAEPFDTAWIDFAKGLGAPLGAVLAGSDELIEEAWRFKQMLGGAMRQTGVVAAACLYALDHHVERLAEDHANARALADGLARIPGVAVDAAAVETNVVVFAVDDARELARELGDAGVEVLPLGPRRLRAVTYLGIGPDDVELALDTIDGVLTRLRRRRPVAAATALPPDGSRDAARQGD